MWYQSRIGGSFTPASVRIERTTIGEGGKLRVCVSAHCLQVAADQRQNAGVAFRDGAEYLAASTGSFDIADPDLHVALPFVTAPDERRVQTEIECRRR